MYLLTYNTWILILRISFVSLDYQVGSDEYYWSETFHFKTFPEGNNWTPRLAIYGDLGHDGESIPSLIKAVQNEEIDLIMHVGKFTRFIYF